MVTDVADVEQLSRYLSLKDSCRDVWVLFCGMNNVPKIQILCKLNLENELKVWMRIYNKASKNIPYIYVIQLEANK